MATRNYRQEYDRYQGKPEQINNREERNAARAQLSKDVDHRQPLAKGGSNSRGNLRAIPASQNRSFARTRTAGMK